MLDKKKKERIIERYKTHDKDTGSPEVQIAILTAEIKELTAHLKGHKKDFSSRRGLIRKVAQRRKLLNYLLRDNEESYRTLIKKLRIRQRAEHTIMPKDDLSEEEITEEAEEELDDTE